MIASIEDVTKFCQNPQTSAEVFVHQPPVSLDTVTTEGLAPCIIIQGNVVSSGGRTFDFMMGDIAAQPYNIAKVKYFRFQFL